MKRLYFTIAAMFSLLPTMASGITIEPQTDQLLLGDSLRFSVVAPEVESVNVELVAPEGYVLEFERLYMKDGCAKGAFYMRPLLLSGLYELRAYTWEDVEADSTDYASRVVAVYQREDDRATILARKRPYLKRIGQRLSLRPFSTEELALLDVETVCGLPCTKEAPSYYENPDFHTGLQTEKPYTHSIVTTTIDAEVRWARKFTEFKYSELRGFEATHEFLVNILRHWQYELLPLRILCLDKMSDIDAVPTKTLLIDDGLISFNLSDYDTIVVRTDYDICEAYSYSNRRPRIQLYDFSIRAYANRSMYLSGWADPVSGRPAIIVCFVRKTDKK